MLTDAGFETRARTNAGISSHRDVGGNSLTALNTSMAGGLVVPASDHGWMPMHLRAAGRVALLAILMLVLVSLIALVGSGHRAGDGSEQALAMSAGGGVRGEGDGVEGGVHLRLSFVLSESLRPR